MVMTILRQALGVPPGTRDNTEKLGASITSLQQTERALHNVVQQILSGPPQVKEKLSPILSRYMTPLESAAKGLDGLLIGIIKDIERFCNLVAQQTAFAEANAANATMRRIDVQMFSTTLAKQADTVESACRNAGGQLIQYRDQVNTTTAQLNSFSEELAQENNALKHQIDAIHSKLEHMAHESFWEKLEHGFEALFGHLEQDLKANVKQMQYEEMELVINKQTISALSQMTRNTGDISSVASALETSWRNLGDSIGGLEQDMTPLTMEITAQEWKDDLAYINSDWQNISQIIEKIIATPGAVPTAS